MQICLLLGRSRDPVNSELTTGLTTIPENTLQENITTVAKLPSLCSVEGISKTLLFTNDTTVKFNAKKDSS